MRREVGLAELRVVYAREALEIDLPPALVSHEAQVAVDVVLRDRLERGGPLPSLEILAVMWSWSRISARTSSREGALSWFLYWPTLLVLLGLPAAIVPKHGGDRLMGAGMAGVGVVLQLGNLGYTSWGLEEALPIVVLLVGVTLVIQALGRTNAHDPGRGAEGLVSHR